MKCITKYQMSDENATRVNQKVLVRHYITIIRGKIFLLYPLYTPIHSPSSSVLISRRLGPDLNVRVTRTPNSGSFETGPETVVPLNGLAGIRRLPTSRLC